jgi:hypothetical protein
MAIFAAMKKTGRMDKKTRLNPLNDFLFMEIHGRGKRFRCIT